jgi:tRNA(Ile)-lysidine synthase TilS/MesJ
MANPDKLAFYLLKSVAKAQRLYHLFEDGDRIAVGVSGGKDSATLVELLRRWTGMPRLDLRAVHVVGAAGCVSGADAARLEAWWRELGIEGLVVPQEGVQTPARGARRSRCFPCAMGRRKALFQAAARMGCNKVALAHHADDVAVTTLLNLVYQGRCETMPAKVALFGGALTLIRPLYLLEEREIVRFARSGVFAFPLTTCSEGDAQRRARIAGILRQLEGEYPRAKRSLLHAVERATAACGGDLVDLQDEAGAAGESLA